MSFLYALVAQSVERYLGKVEAPDSNPGEGISILKTMRKEKSCGIIPYRIWEGVIEFLLVQHNLGKQHWSIPKGHTENGESEEETAIRETAEETGYICQITPGFKKEIIYSPKANTEKQVVFFLGTVKQEFDNTKFKHEIKARRWVSYEEAILILEYKNAQNVLREAHEFLKQQV